MGNDFRKLLNVKNESSLVDSRILKRINIKQYALFIQASAFHYCEPRKTLPDLNRYKSMEVAIFEDDSWIDLEEEEFFNDWEYRKEFLENYDGMVGGYIPIHIIQSLYDYIKKRI